MSGKLTTDGANQVLDAESGLFLQHHTGAPGAGLDNVSANFGSGSRLAVSWAAAAARSMSNDIEVVGSVTTGESISHWSLWTLAAGGVCRWTGNWNTPRTYLPGDSVRVEIGDLVLTYPT